MSSSRSRQYTVRSIPPALDKALRQEARRQRRSLNAVVLEALARGLGQDTRRKHHDLDHLIGTWVHDPEFDKAIEEQRQIDPEMWK